MGMLESISKFVFDRVVAFEDAFNDAKPKLQSGTYTLDQFFKDSTKFWIDSADDLAQLFPSLPLDTIPVSYKTVGSGATSFTELVNPGFFPFNAKLEDTGLIPLTGGKATSGKRDLTAQPDGTLQIDISSLKSQKSGELYQDIVFYKDTALKVHPVVVLQIQVT